MEIAHSDRRTCAELKEQQPMSNGNQVIQDAVIDATLEAYKQATDRELLEAVAVNQLNLARQLQRIERRSVKTEDFVDRTNDFIENDLPNMKMPMGLPNPFAK